MSPTALRDLITRVAVDDAFAERVQADPASLAAEFGLDEAEVATLTALRVDPATRRPSRLEERLSRSALFFGGEMHASEDSGGGDSGGGDHGSSDSGSSGSSDSGSGSSDSGSSDSGSHSDSGSSDPGSSDSGSSDSGSSDSGSSGSDSHTTSDSGSTEHEATTHEATTHQDTTDQDTTTATTHQTVVPDHAADQPTSSQATTSAPAADPNSSYHGGVVKEVPTTTADGTTVHLTHGDGTTSDLQRTVDGTTTVDTSTDADGTHVVHTADATTGTDHTEANHPDGSATSTDRSPGALTETVTRPDHTTVATSWAAAGTNPAPNAPLYTTHETAANGATVTSTVRPTAAGGFVATIRSSDGTLETVRVTESLVDNPDGSTTRVFTYPDGDTQAFTFDVDGNPVHHQATSHDGTASTTPVEATTPTTPATPAAPITGPAPTTSVPSSPMEPGPNTPVTMTPTADPYVAAHPFLTGLMEDARVSSQTQPNGNEVTVWDQGDGSATTWTLHADGSGERVDTNTDGAVVGTWALAKHSDGSVTQTDTAGNTVTYDPDGHTTTMTRDGAGGWSRTEAWPDGHSSNTTAGHDAAGAAWTETSSTVPHTDGSATTTIHTRSGGLQTVEYGPDGLMTGYTETHTDAYGQTVTTVHDALGRQVGGTTTGTYGSQPNLAQEWQAPPGPFLSSVEVTTATHPGHPLDAGDQAIFRQTYAGSTVHAVEGAADQSVVTHTYPDGTTVTSTYAMHPKVDFGSWQNHNRPNGATWTYGPSDNYYDPINWTSELVSTTTTHPNPDGSQLQMTTYPDGHMKLNGYDPLGRHVLRTDYDTQGHVTRDAVYDQHSDGSYERTRTFPDGTKTVDDYDTAGTKTSHTDIAADGASDKLNLDATGHTTSREHVDADGLNWWQEWYDPYGRAISFSFGGIDGAGGGNFPDPGPPPSAPAPDPLVIPVGPIVWPR